MQALQKDLKQKVSEQKKLVIQRQADQIMALLSQGLLNLYYIELQKQMSPEGAKLLNLIKQGLKQSYDAKLEHIRKTKLQAEKIIGLLQKGLQDMYQERLNKIIENKK